MATRANIWLACLVFAGVIFLADLYLPLHVAAGALYVVVILLTAWTSQHGAATIAAAVCSMLIVAAAVFSRGDHDVNNVLANRGALLFAVWVAAYVVYRWGRSRRELAALNKELERRVADRTTDAHHRAAELEHANAQLQREIAQRQKAENESRHSQAMYASLVEDLPIPIIRKDDTGRFVFANRAFCSWVGRKSEEVVGSTDFDFSPEPLAAKYQRDDQSVLTTGELFLDVERNEHGGKVNWVHVIKTPARDADGAIVGTQAIFWDVTARREAEDRLRDSETLYHSLVDSLPVCLLRKDIEGNFTFVNTTYCEFFGVASKDIVGKNDFDIFPHELALRYREGDRQVIESGEAYEDVERIQLRDGRMRHIDVIKTAVYDADACVVGVQIIFSDVTDELALQAELKNVERRLQAILDNTSTVVYVKDMEGRYLLINREFETLFGVRLAEIVGKNDYDLFPAEFADAFRAVDKRVAEHGETIEIEEVAPQADGLHTYISSKFPLRGDRGEVYAVAGISTDITGRKRAEEQLRESQQRLNLALTSAEIGTWSWDITKDEIFWDDRTHDIFGLRRDTFAGTHEGFVKMLHPDDVARVQDAMEECLRRGDDFDIDYRIIWPEGNLRHITARAAVLRDDDGQPVRMTGVCLDITERKGAEQQLRRYASRLEATNRELEEFAYIVSHDLQEPLRTLSFFSDSLQADLADSLSGDARRDLQFIADAAQRMQQLVRDLLTLSRAGRAEMKRDPVPLRECVQAALDALSTRIRETGAQVDVSDLPTIQGDRTLLTQLFQNLVGNALKFVGPDDLPHVRVVATRRDGAWVVGVQDNGIGIQPEYAKKIFAPFQRLHASSEYEGTGIGLAICRKVVQRHGGTIWVESQLGHGAHFKFELPADVK